MRAVVHREYGGPEVLRCEEVPRPQPRPGEVLVRVHAAALNPMNVHLMRGRLARLALGLRRPKLGRPGADLAGEVEAVGEGVTRFAPGQRVFGVARGALAEFVCAPEGKLAPIPDGVSFGDAAALPVAGLTALQGLRDRGGLAPGDKVLVLGAAGGVGTFAVQIAKALGARVTGVCSSANAELVGSIGADRVIDYQSEDFLRSGERYDIIVDLVGARSFFALRRVLAPAGVVVAGGILGAGGDPKTGWFLRCLIRSAAGAAAARFGKQRLRFFLGAIRPDDLAALAAMVQEGRIKPVIGATFPLEAAADGFRVVASGHARGKVIIHVAP